MTDRKIYIDKFAEKLKQFDDEIEKLETKAGSSLNAVKEKLEESINVIQLKRKNVGDRFSDLQKSGSDAWMEIRMGLENVEKDLHTAIVKAKKKF